MTTITNQIKCSLCNINIDQLERMSHLVSANHLQRCENNKAKVAINFFEQIFETYSKKSKKYNLKNKKTLHFWHSYFAANLPKEKIDVLRNDSINISELEDSLTKGLLKITLNATHEVGKTYFKLLDKITYCEICSIEIIKSLVFNHNNSNKHRYF